MSYFGRTIADLDRVLDTIERTRLRLLQSGLRQEASHLHDALDDVRLCRNKLIAHQHDRDRKATR